MGQGASIPKCHGCDKSTPFFGEIYGRMNDTLHSFPSSGIGHKTGDSGKPEYAEFNSFKNQLLIPFYGTALAIKVLAAAMMKDVDEWEDCGLSFNFTMNLKSNNELEYWFVFRTGVALIPVVGTIINGSLDIISQIGIQ